MRFSPKYENCSKAERKRRRENSFEKEMKRSFFRDKDGYTEGGEEGWFSSRAVGLGRRRRVEEGGCRQDQRAVLVRAFEARGAGGGEGGPVTGPEGRAIGW